MKRHGSKKVARLAQQFQLDNSRPLPPHPHRVHLHPHQPLGPQAVLYLLVQMRISQNERKTQLI